MRRLRPTFRRAFSLLELVVVIGIIVLLAGLVLAVGTGLLSQSYERQTTTAMQLVDSAIDEWQVSTGRQFTYGTNGFPTNTSVYDFQEALADNQTIVEVLRAVSGPEQGRTILSRVDQNLLRTVPAVIPNAAPDREFVDSWDSRVVVVFPGRAWLPSDGLPAATKDADGTLRTAREKRLGICRNGKILLVSAGPDGQLGDLSGNDSAMRLAGDNVYSYEPEAP